MLNIYYGRESLNKEKFIFDRLPARALILVPDQYTLEAERQAFRCLGTNALMDVEVVSPASLGENILAELGGSQRTFINKYGRHMLLFKSAVENQDKLEVFRGLESQSSFLDAVNDFISEMKQYSCRAEDLRIMGEKSQADTYTKKKLMDVYTLFAHYEKQIEGRYTDSEDYIDLYLEKIKDSQQIRGNDIWVYGFDSLAPKTMALLGQLMATAHSVNLVLTWDKGGRDEDLFRLTGMVMDNAQRLAEALGVECHKEPIPRSYMIEDKSPALVHLEQELYSMPVHSTKETDGVTLVEAAGLYNEAESAAAYVMSLVRDKGLRYRDIRLVANDLDTRGPIIERVFQEYGVQVFADQKRDILASPVIQFITSLLDVVIEKYSTEALFGMLKSGFGDLTAQELADLENYGIKYKIKGTMWTKPLKRGKAEYGEDGLAKLEELRQRALRPVPPERMFKASDASDHKLTTGELLSRFYSYLTEDLHMREKVLDFIAEQEERGLFDLADETAAIWQSLSGVLDQIYEIMGEEPYNGPKLREILSTGLEQVQIGLLPPTEDGLILGNIQRSRSARVKAMVILGANEGVLPQEKPTQGLFSAEERELFKQEGKELCKVDSVRFMEEKLAVYRNLCTATDYLWVSYSLTDGEGSEMKPSSVFQRLTEIFPMAQVQKDILNQEDKTSLINAEVSGLRNLTTLLGEAAEGKGLDQKWGEALSWFEKNRPSQMEAIRRAFGFDNKQEALGQAVAQALFKNDQRDIDGIMSLSPSRLERFSRCPFSHLVNYGLRPEERRIFEAAPREIGDVYHRCLMALAKELTQEGTDITDPWSPWMRITKEQCDDIVKREIDQLASQYREGLFKAGPAEDYRLERLTEICQQVCMSMVEQVRAGQILDMRPEVAFGRKGDLPPIEVVIGGQEGKAGQPAKPGQKVYIEGIIDRVDYLPDDRVKIVDYKTGSESFNTQEAAAGYRLQLMLYLDAACRGEGKPAGVFYFKIKEPMVDLSQKDIDLETVSKEIQKSFKLDGVMVDDPSVIHSIAGEFDGFSQILPIKKTKEGIKNTGRPGLLEAHEFTKLRQEVQARVKEACENLLDGNIEIHPMKTKDRSACTYCQYKGICRFDTIFKGCSYNIVK